MNTTSYFRPMLVSLLAAHAGLALADGGNIVIRRELPVTPYFQLANTPKNPQTTTVNTDRSPEVLGSMGIGEANSALLGARPGVYGTQSGSTAQAVTAPIGSNLSTMGGSQGGGASGGASGSLGGSIANTVTRSLGIR
ncbi:hypothetical protein [Microvirgula aerodenitrificans]|uniref:Fap n=1 Tax=Microvirgula aerodenitrificans TaxID=57480 RepID=A0A2S0P979_9NEIS|nr:hypothetical protein [Microvirgula aerodenitrificans]AVY93916.1 hypothetical protein DAI18_07560 [Microvirgula aerodenitrificans]